MDEMNRTDLNTRRRTPRIGTRIVLVLFAAVLVSVIALYLSRFLGRDAWYETVIGNTTKTIELISRMRINLVESTDLEKGAVMAVTDEESQALAEQSRKSSDAVERDYQELKVLIDAAKIDKEMKLLKEFSDDWNNFRLIDKELLSLAVENTNIKAANLSFTAAARAVADFERRLSELMNVPTSDAERARDGKVSLSSGYRRIYDLQPRSPAHQ